jgi:RimJ/RimL family protein N-acetyltransferase
MLRAMEVERDILGGPSEHIPDVIRTARLVLRCWRRDDAEPLKEAIDGSLPELRLWVPWAMDYPSTIDGIKARLERMQAQFAAGEDWPLGIFDSQQTRVLGGAGLHPTVGNGGLAIGYWIRTDATRQGFATEVAEALCAAAFARAGVERVEVHCDRDNERSAAIPMHLGFTLTRTFRQDLVTARGPQRDTLVWTLRRAEFEASRQAGT